MTLDEAMAYALALEGAELATHYGAQAVKVNGHPIVGPCREDGSFALHLSVDTKLLLMETEPETYWQTPHYDGWPAVLVRYDAADEERVRAMIDEAHRQALGRKPPRKRR